MPKTDRLSGCNDWIDLSFVERERTPPQLMELGIRLHLADLSLSNTVRKLEKFGIKRSHKAVHDWVHKCDLQPAVDEESNHVSLDETVIQLDEHFYWLSTAVDPDTNKTLRIRLYSTTMTVLTERFLHELTEKHDLDDAVFFVNGAKHLQIALRRSGLRFDTKTWKIGTLLNVSFVRWKIEDLRSQTVSAMHNRQQPNRGSKPSPSGTILQTKHDSFFYYRRAKPVSQGVSKSS